MKRWSLIAAYGLGLLVLRGYDQLRELADCRDARDVLSMVTAYAIVWVPLLWALWP